MPRQTAAAALVGELLDLKRQTELASRTLSDLRADLEHRLAVRMHLALDAIPPDDVHATADLIRAAQPLLARPDASPERQAVTIIVEGSPDAGDESAAVEAADAGPASAAAGEHRLRAVG